MSAIRIAMLGVTSMLLVAVVCGCAMMGGVSDAKLLDQTLASFEAAYRAKDIDNIMVHFSDNYDGSNGGTKDNVRQSISRYIDGGVFNDFSVDFLNAEKTFKDGMVVVGPVTWITPSGSSDYTYVFKKEDGALRIVDSYQM